MSYVQSDNARTPRIEYEVEYRIFPIFLILHSRIFIFPKLMDYLSIVHIKIKKLKRNASILQL